MLMKSSSISHMYKTILIFQDGFTIIELMVIVAIAAILLTLGLPSYQLMLRNNCMTSTSTGLVTSLQLARSEAIKRRANVSVVAGQPGAGPGPATNEWGGGWYVWFDSNSDGNYDANEELRVTLPVCTATIDETTADRTVMVYGSDGFIFNSGSFAVCIDSTGETGRQVDISATGRPNTDELTCTSP
jgi:type IV fimbrial biogenesis protein FimT